MTYAAWSVVFGEQPSAAKWNILGTNDAHFYSFLGDNLAWQTWVPTLTNLSGGITTYAKYIQIGKTVFFRWKYVLAGAGISGGVTISLPVAVASGYGTDDGDGIQVSVHYRDTGTSNYPGGARFSAASALALYALKADATYTTLASLSSTVPHTWAATDVLIVDGCYEVT